MLTPELILRFNIDGGHWRMCQQLKYFEKIGVIFPPFYQQQTEKGPRRCSKGMIYTSDITNVCLS